MTHLPKIRVYGSAFMECVDVKAPTIRQHLVKVALDDVQYLRVQCQRPDQSVLDIMNGDFNQSSGNVAPSSHATSTMRRSEEYHTLGQLIDLMEGFIYVRLGFPQNLGCFNLIELH